MTSNKDSRIVYTSRKQYGLTQGSIISGIKHPRYKDCVVWGCVITPRCDMARGIEVPTVHVLPIVDLSSWLECDGRDTIIAKGKKKISNLLHNELPEKTFSKNIFKSGFSISELRELIETERCVRCRENALKYFDAYVDENDDAYKIACENGGKNSTLAELRSDKIASCYLIESWKVDDCPKVILLRDVFHITREIALRYKFGFIEFELNESDLIENNLKQTQDRDFEFQIESQIASPIMEHIMQRFAYNFTRIGVEDKPADIIDLMTNES